MACDILDSPFIKRMTLEISFKLNRHWFDWLIVLKVLVRHHVITMM